MRQGLSRLQIQNQNYANIRVTPDNKERQSHSAVPSCCNHQEKPATHSLYQNQPSAKLYYCQKCSIMLASKGYNIQKLGRANSTNKRQTIQKEPVKNQRQKQIQQFLGQLSWHIQEINQRNTEAESSLRSSQQHFHNMIDQVTQYFKEIQEILEIQKYMSYNAILNHRAGLESDIRMMRQSLQCEIEELIGIGNDIQNNMEAVESVEVQIYESIMNNYKSKANLAYQYHQIEIKSIPKPTIVFPDIPKMLYSLADKIHMRNDVNPVETIMISQPITVRPSLTNLTNRSIHSKNQSCENSKSKNQTILDQNKSENPKSKLANFINMKNTESIDQKQVAFSFQSQQQLVAYYNNNRQEFTNSVPKRRQGFHPQELYFRESLSLTEIRENQDEFELNCNKRYGCLLEQTIPIPQEVITSRQSIEGYFITDTLGYSLKEDTQYEGQETETLLIA